MLVLIFGSPSWFMPACLALVATVCLGWGGMDIRSRDWLREARGGVVFLLGLALGMCALGTAVYALAPTPDDPCSITGARECPAQMQ